MKVLNKIVLKILLFTLFIMGSNVVSAAVKERVIPGIERVAEYQEVFAGKRVGLITNQTGADGKLQSSADILKGQTDLRAVFVPEHGLFGAEKAGKSIGDAVYNGIPVRSLYGDSKRPSAAMLEDIDVLAFDIQDVGVRHYTYISTLAYALEACGKYGKTFVVFDRPNPLGSKVEGPVLKPGFESFIGLYPIPLRHGLTVGEYAEFINREFGLGAKLVVIPMRNWRRNMYFSETGLPWIASSPNIPTDISALCYAATGIVGNMYVSVGVGTTKPFEYIGAPWADKFKIADKLNALGLPGVYFRPMAFEPFYGLYANEICEGVQMHITDKALFKAAETGAQIVRLFMEEYPDKIKFSDRELGGYKIDISVGENTLRDPSLPLAQLFARWEQESKAFKALTRQYWLYPEQ